MAKSTHHGKKKPGDSRFARRQQGTSSGTQAKPINPLKSKIRDVERLLAHADHLPADVRIEKERALAGYKQDLDYAIQERQKQKLITKYHKVRFFERQKASRNLKRLRKSFAEISNDSDREALEQAIQRAEIDLNYTIYYPLMEKYVSLFARSDSDDQVGTAGQKGEPDNNPTRDGPMWKLVMSSTQEGTLESLRDGKLSAKYSTQKKPKQIASLDQVERENVIQKRRSVNQKGSGKAQHANDEDSDEGFFE